MSGMTTGTWWTAGSSDCDWPWLPDLLRRREPHVPGRLLRTRRFTGWNLLWFARLPSGDAAQPVSDEDARDIRECLESDEEPAR
jgi:hypothetical protein